MLGSILALLFAALLIFVVARIERMRDRLRTEAMRQLAVRLGYRFAPALDTWWPPLPIFARGTNRGLLNTMTTTIRVGERPCRMRLGDAQCIVKSGRSSTRVLFSYVLVDSPYPPTPDLVVRHESVMDRVADALGFDDIDLESAEFSRKFRVKCADRRFAWDFLHARMMQLLLESTEGAFEVGGDLIVVSDGWTRWEPRAFASRIELMQRILELWPEHRKEAARAGGAA